MRDHAARPSHPGAAPLVYALALGMAWWLEGRWSLGFFPGGVGRALGWGLIGLGLAGFAWAWPPSGAITPP
jgi:hypothetical protein